LPVRRDPAAHAVVVDVRPGHAAARPRRDADALVAGRLAADASDRLGHPLVDGAERVVGEAVHAGIFEALLGRPAVPALPDARRPLPDREAPRRVVDVLDEAPR